MMRRLYLIYIVAIGLLLTSCDPTIHLYPKPQQAEVIIVPWFRLRPYTAYKELLFDEAWHCQERRLDDHDILDPQLPDGTQMSLTLDVLRGTMRDDELREWRGDLCERHTLTTAATGLAYADTIHTRLADGSYHIAAWADYLPSLYDRHTLSAIDTDLRAFPACPHLQNAQAGREEFAIDYQLGPEGYPLVKGYEAKDRVVPVELRRTQGRFRIEAIDLRDYLRENPAAGPITVKAVFTMYVSCGFNALTDLPNKFVSTYTLNAPSQQPQPAASTDLLTHYVFAPPTGETAVLCDFYLYHADGTLFNTCQGLQIPIRRGGETVVRGHFLTHFLQHHGGLGVDENFQGEYVVPFDY